VRAAHGSHGEYEAAQKRVLEVFEPWQPPESITFHEFLVRVGGFGGYTVVETDDVAAVQRLTTLFAIFRFRVEPVMDVIDAAVVGGSPGATRSPAERTPPDRSSRSRRPAAQSPPESHTDRA
jgi:hypothetical protein